MLRRLIPREERFFDRFRESADLIVQGARELRAILSDLPHSENLSRRLKEIEQKADEVTYQTIELLHKTFITPLDRGDIHELITKMDDILDLIQATSQRLYVYDVRTVTDEALSLADICIKSTEEIREAVKQLENLKNIEIILKHCKEISRLEKDADAVLRTGMAKLFRDESDVRQLIKLKEIYQLLETVTDCCKNVANIIEGIVVENA